MQKKYLIIGGAALLFIIIVVLALLFSNNTPQQQAVEAELVWWKTFEDRQDVQQLITDYQALNKGVRITYVKKDIATYEEELIDAIASGRGPDILTIHNDWLPKHVDKLAPMPANMMSVRQYNETFVDVASTDFIRDGQIYAVPMALDVLALYYNKDILNSVGISEPPTTWTEVVSASERITRQDDAGNFTRSGIALGTASNVNRAADILSLLMLQNGTQFYDTNLNVTIDRQIRNESGSYNPAEVALEFYTQFADAGKRSYTWNTQTNNSVDAFTQGNVGMMLSYAYMQEIIRDKAPTLNWDVSDAPQIDNSGLKVNLANYWGEAVSKSASAVNQQVAWNFLNFITQKEALEVYYADNLQPASRKDMTSAQFSDLDIGVFAENVLTAQSVYKPDAGLFEGIFIKMIEDVTVRGLDPSEALNNASQQLRIIPKR